MIRTSLLLAAFFLLTELVLHALVAKSDLSYGKFFGEELPPLKLELLSPRTFRFRTPKGTFTAIGNSRILVPDADAGYVFRDNGATEDGAIRTNNFGARSDSPLAARRAPGRPRLVFYGDSTTFGYGLDRKDTFLSRLQELRPAWEVVNMGVGSYSLGQAYSLYRRQSARIESDVDVFVLVPLFDNQRERNVIRTLMGARSFELLPVYREEGDKLTLAHPPRRYFDASAPEAGVHEYFDHLPADLQDYIAGNDAFFWRPYYAESRLLDRSILYKMVVSIFQHLRQRRLLAMPAAYDPDGLFLPKVRRLTRKIFDETAASGGKTVLVLLPGVDELKLLQSNEGYRRKWKALVEALRYGSFPVIDGADPLLRQPPDPIDFAYDQHHPGPSTSAAIARALAESLGPLLPGNLSPSPR